MSTNEGDAAAHDRGYLRQVLLAGNTRRYGAALVATNPCAEGCIARLRRLAARRCARTRDLRRLRGLAALLQNPLERSGR